ncbi:hypothetical protein LTR85_011932 [Meristemomyces frigidus]|nr:hypothetical protein LTR85_011932 [Meristemomyces frigidus]
MRSNDRMMRPRSESLLTFEYSPVIEPAKSKHMYNNHAYNAVGMLLERLSGLEYGTLVRRPFFELLGMRRTVSRSVDDYNVAKPYNILLDKTAFVIPPCETSDDTTMFAGQAVRSCLGNLLTFDGPFLSSIAQVTPVKASPDVDRGPAPGLFAQVILLVNGSLWPMAQQSSNQFQGLPMKSLLQLVGTCTTRGGGSMLEQSYATGWNRTQLPGRLDFAWNEHFVDPFPVLKGAYPGKLAIWHGGNMPGTTAAACMLPETGTAVVAL